ncbi:MAG: hypothetical protein U0X86_000359 [Wolbachia endosymbiont of Xenopsylla cheopis]
MRKLFQSANPELAETTVLLTSQEIEKQNHPILNATPVKFKIRVEEIPVEYYIESSVNDLENLNSKKATLENFQKACEYYNKSIEYHKSNDWPYSSDTRSAREFQAEAVLGFFSIVDKEDADLVESFNTTHQLRVNTEEERNKMLSRIEQKSKLQSIAVKKIHSNNVYEVDKPQQAGTIKKIMICAAITSSFIAVGLYTAVALSNSEFNPVAAAAVFVGIVVLSAICFATVKVCEKVSEEKDNNPNIGTLTALKNILTSECCKSKNVLIES